MKRLTLLVNICFILLFLVGITQTTVSASGSPSLPILFGAYPSGDLYNSIGELTAMNNWLTSNGANGVTFAADFINITYYPSSNVPNQLNAAWNAGFVPFMNMMSSQTWEPTYDPNCVTAGQIANGSCDAKLTTFANAFKTWANQGGGRRAFLAPLPEANGNWAPYSSDGPTFISAFIRIRQIFENAGVPRKAVRWVFAPNGWSQPGHEFENYYPGDNYTDVLAYSAYNYGACPNFKIWDTFERAFQPYLGRMRVMAPSKPIFIAQTGTVNVPVDPANPNQTKSAWLYDTFSKLANYPAVRGIIYFNKTKNEGFSNPNCQPADYRLFYGGSQGEVGFLNIMKDNSRFGKWSTSSSNWDNIAFADPAYVFSDVPPNHPFSGEPNIWYYTDVHKLYNNGVTGGCANAPLRYCPNDSVTRAQMAVFLEKGMHGSGFTPPAVPITFSDTGGHWAQYWIEALKKDGITSGCGSGRYCPENLTTRAEMAIFLLRSKHGVSYVPPAATGTMFNDVPANYWAARWIEQLAKEGITSGCGTAYYCPDSSVNRAQMAVFLVKTFNLP